MVSKMKIRPGAIEMSNLISIAIIYVNSKRKTMTNDEKGVYLCSPRWGC